MRRSIRWMVAAVAGTLLLLTACGTFTTGATPEEAIERRFAKVGVAVAPANDGLMRLTMRDFGTSAIGLYQKPGDTSAMTFQIAWRNEDGWYTNQCCDGGAASFTNCCVDPQPWIHFGSEHVANKQIVFGRRVDPRVYSVSVIFDNGVVGRDIVKDDVSVTYTQGAMSVCAIKVYAEDGTLLRHADSIGRPLPEFNSDQKPSCPK
jgi:hypothetical protein